MKIVAASSINSDAAKIKEYLNHLTYNINFIKDYVDALPQLWSGEDARKFTDKYRNEVLPALREYERNFVEYYNFLTKVYDVFRTLDESYNKPINTD